MDEEEKNVTDTPNDEETPFDPETFLSDLINGNLPGDADEEEPAPAETEENEDAPAPEADPADSPEPSDPESESPDAIARIAEKLQKQFPELSPAALSKMAYLEHTRGKQGNELGTLRKQVQEFTSQKPTEPARSEPEPEPSEFGPNGYPLDELGIEVVPVDDWYSEEFLDNQIQVLISEGKIENEDDPRAMALATARADRHRANWERSYNNARSEAQEKQSNEERQRISQNEPLVRAAIQTIRTNTVSQVGAVVPGLTEDAGKKIADAVQVTTYEVLKKAIEAGTIRESDITPEMVQSAAQVVIGQMFTEGNFAKIVADAMGGTPGARPGKSVMDAFSGGGSGGGGTESTRAGNSKPTGMQPSNDDRKAAKALDMTIEAYMEMYGGVWEDTK